MESKKTEVLKNEYQRRRTRNARYSLRSFARDLSVSHTILSLILSGKRPVSNDMSRRLLGFETLTAEERLVLQHKNLTQDPTARHKMSLEHFAVISDWIHYGILSLLDVEQFEWDAVWIGERLNIPPAKAKAAMGRLLKLRLVERDSQGFYRQGVDPIVVENPHPTLATRTFNKQLIQKALVSMEEDSTQTRDLSNMVFAMDPAHMPYAVARIRQFRRELSAELEGMKSQKEVYALTVQLFPLSKNRGPK